MAFNGASFITTLYSACFVRRCTDVPGFFEIYKMCLNCLKSTKCAWNVPRPDWGSVASPWVLRCEMVVWIEERERGRGEPPFCLSVYTWTPGHHMPVYTCTQLPMCPQQQTILNRLCWGREPVANTLAMFLCNTVMWPFRLFLWQSRCGQAGISFNIIGFILPST